MKMKFTFFSYLLVLVTLYSCKKIQPEKKDNNHTILNLKYAEGFDVLVQDNDTLLVIKSPYLDAQEPIVYSLSTIKKTKKNQVQIPLTSVIVSSTTHIPMLELLSVENSLVGFPNTRYISSEKTLKRIDQKLVADIGQEENINTELLLKTNPDAIIAFSVTSNANLYKNLENVGIPVIINGDWLEKTPLGRAEWIKFFGLLFNKNKEADSIFNEIEHNYLMAKKLVENVSHKPTIVSGGLFKDIWNLPAGNSFEAALYKDAQANYLWSESTGNGSLSLSLESVFEKGKNADYWFSPSFYKSKNELKIANNIYTKFKAFKNNTIYSYVNTVGKNGGVIYFELAPSRPDLVLKDLIKILHPELLQEYSLTFYKQLD